MSDNIAQVEVVAPFWNEEARIEGDDGERLSDVRLTHEIINEIPVDLSAYDELVTSMNGWFANGLKALSQADDSRLPSGATDDTLGEGITHFFMNPQKMEDDDDVENKQEAQFKAWKWARKQFYIDAFDAHYPHQVDTVIVVNLGGYRGSTILEHARDEYIDNRMSVSAMELCNYEEVKEDKEESVDSEAASEADQLVNGGTDEPEADPTPANTVEQAEAMADGGESADNDGPMPVPTSPQ